MYKIFPCLNFLTLLLLHTNAYHHGTGDEFLDIAVQLKGNPRDVLIADLIAEEKDLINAGHVCYR